jgi:hypothetical protein
MVGIFMSRIDQRTNQLCQDCLCGRLTIQELSTMLSKSYRQAQRIIIKLQKKGMLGIKQGNTGKTPINKTSSFLKKEIKSPLKNDYYDFNLTHFRDMLVEKEGIVVGKNIIHRIAKRTR